MTAENLIQMQARFHKLVSYLRNFGFNGEVFLKAGTLIIGARDKNSASMIRKAFKAARNTGNGVLTEVRSRNGAAFVWLAESHASLSKQEIRQLALAA